MPIVITRFAVPMFAAVAFASSAFAQDAPPTLQPLPDVPPPPKLSTTPTPDDDDSPRITIRQDEGGAKVEEFRTRSGRVYAVRVTPSIGKPYVLVDPDGRGVLPPTSEIPAGEITGGIHPAQWTIFEW